MRIATQKDIRDITFHHKRNPFTGKIMYDGDQVDDFLDYVEASLRALEIPVAEYVAAQRKAVA